VQKLASAGWAAHEGPAGAASTPAGDVEDPEEVTEQVAVRMRLTRVGSTKKPIYRIVVVDSHARRDGRAIETVGHYDPRTEPSAIEIDADKAKAWLAKGAQPSRTVKRLLAIKGIDN